MINDTVREELETKISRTGEPAVSTSGRLSNPTSGRLSNPTSGTLAAPTIEAPKATPKIEVPAPRMEVPTPTPPPARQAAPPVKQTAAPAAPAPEKPMGTRFNTNDLRTKKTSPTLVEFQTKKATVPEWRLQLQNTVRQKVSPDRRATASSETQQPTPRTTSGANALKVEFVEEQEPRHQNPRVASALKRIEESRKAFTNQPVPEQSLHVGKAAPAARNYPFNVVARSNEQPPRPSDQKPLVNASPKPILVSAMKIEKKGFDTNKLPKLQTHAEPSKSFILAAKRCEVAEELSKVDETALEIETVESDEIDDLAPLSMRFNAGLFDLIIGVFATLILLSPFIVSGGTWLSFSGGLAIAASVAIVMFLYLTISIAFVSRSLGMRLFSLELVDVEENAYPTLHQAAVNSSVYLLSLVFVGIGFIPMFFNEEKRAAHDILSGTILIREV